MALRRSRVRVPPGPLESKEPLVTSDERFSIFRGQRIELDERYFPGTCLCHDYALPQFESFICCPIKAALTG